MKTPRTPPLFPLAKPVFAAFIPENHYTRQGNGAKNLNRVPLPAEVTFRECVMAFPIEDDVIGQTVARPVVLDLHGYVLAANMPGFSGYFETNDPGFVCRQLAEIFPAAA